MQIGQDDALDGLGPEKRDLLRECLEEAWKQYEATFRPILPYCTRRGMANILHELMVQQVRTKFDGVPGVVVQESWVKNRFLVEISGVMVLQFRKLTRDFQTRNIRTRTSTAFDLQGEVEGMPSLPRVTVGYQLGQYNTEIAGLWLAFLVGKEPIWYSDLRTGEASTTLEFPAPDTGAADQEEADEERRKKLDEGNENEEKKSG